MLKVEDIEKEYEKDKPVLKGVSFNLQEDEIMALVGESGCGKTTLLRSIAGFESIKKGSINLLDSLLAGDRVHIEPERRNIGFLFQDYALFPHLTVTKNILFGLTKLDKNKQNQRVQEVLGLLGIEELKDRYPHELSGGQQQRVALARSLAPKPRILLMDEPFSNIDGLLKEKVLSELKTLLKANHVAVIVVTHDMKEAIQFSDKIVVLNGGKVEQCDTPELIYRAPKSKYVASYFGKTNFIPVKVENRKVKLNEVVVEINEQSSMLQKGDLLVRYQDLEVAENGIEANVQGSIFEGDQHLIVTKTEFGELKFYSDNQLFKGDTLKLRLKNRQYVVLSN